MSFVYKSKLSRAAGDTADLSVLRAAKDSLPLFQAYVAKQKVRKGYSKRKAVVLDSSGGTIAEAVKRRQVVYLAVSIYYLSVYLSVYLHISIYICIYLSICRQL